jgi:hypothetical protein
MADTRTMPIPPARTAEEWADRVVDLYRAQIAALGHPVPPVAVSPGWTSGGRRQSQVLGECWTPRVSTDHTEGRQGTVQIYLSPRIDDDVMLAHVILHEVIHAAVGLEHGHRGEFKRVALALGFAGKMEASRWSEEAREDCARRLDEAGVGPYPRPRFRDLGGGVIIRPGKPEKPGDGGSSGPKTQGTRMIKVHCPACGYTLRTTRRWLDVAVPACPVPDCDRHGQTMARADAGETPAEGEEG